jgi:hypothetical protein
MPKWHNYRVQRSDSRVASTHVEENSANPGWHRRCFVRLVPRRSTPLHITIVANNPETLDGLELYMRRAGVTTNGTRRIAELLEMTPASTSVVVLFPDDFDWSAVCSALAKLRSEQPTVLSVLITSQPKRFESLPMIQGGITPLVIPKPVWGWTILDSIRARLDDPSDPDSKPR